MTNNELSSEKDENTIFDVSSILTDVNNTKHSFGVVIVDTDNTTVIKLLSVLKDNNVFSMNISVKR